MLPSRSLFLVESGTIVVGDLHFGKVQHFRRAGLPVPPSASRRNAENLIDLVNKTNPKQIIFLGDLFHSHYNEDWEVVGQIVNHFPACKFRLIRGNHDIMTALQYQRKGIEVVESERIGPFLLTHEPMETDLIPKGMINLAGHVHPGARLEGKGRQSLTFPCFFVTPNQIILPAFGSFTGLFTIRPRERDRVFIIVEDQIMEAPGFKTTSVR